jgi:hypothetical protein
MSMPWAPFDRRKNRMSTRPTQARRFPLGLPEGYVRSLLALMIVGLSCGLILLSTVEKPKPLPLFLVFLLLLIYPNFIETMVHARSNRDETWSAWFVRILIGLFILAAPVASVVWKLNNDPQALSKQMDETWKVIETDIREHPDQLLMSVGLVWGGYCVGVIARYISRRTRHLFLEEGQQAVLLPDVIAWISLLAMVGMTVLMLFALVINPSLEEHPPIALSGFGDVVAGIVAFYFGVRSGS